MRFFIFVLVSALGTSAGLADPSGLLAPDNPQIASGWRPPRSAVHGIETFTPVEPKDWIQLNKDVSPKSGPDGMSGMKGMGEGVK